MARKRPCLQCPGCHADVPNTLAYQRPDWGGRWRWLSEVPGTRYDCPKCGRKLEVSVTDDYAEDALASLVEVAAGSSGESGGTP